MACKGVSQTTIKTLHKELTTLMSQPMEGFKLDVESEENILIWNVAIFGPPDTIYEGGYFKAQLKFPEDYPYRPPTVHFTTKMFHPNIYEDGLVCISILHENDPMTGEPLSTQWSPTQSVRTILLSVISLLNEPNTNSPANVDASVSYRRWKESNGLDDEYKRTVRQLVENTFNDAMCDGVDVPKSQAEYCVSGRPTHRNSLSYYEGLMDESLYDDNDVFTDSDEVSGSSSDNLKKGAEANAEKSGCHKADTTDSA